MDRKLCIKQGWLPQPKCDRSAVLSDSFKFTVALFANDSFEIFSINIHAALLQAKGLDHDVFVVPPADIK